MKYFLRDIAFLLRPWKLTLKISRRDNQRIKIIAPVSDFFEHSHTEDVLFFVPEDSIDQTLSQHNAINIITCSENAAIIEAGKYPEVNYLIIHEKTDMSTICSRIVNLLMKNVNEMNVFEILLEALNSNSQKKGTLISTIEGLLGNPVTILDSSFEIIITSRPDFFALKTEDRKLNIDHDKVRKMLESSKTATFCTTKDPNERFIAAPINVAGITSGYVIVYEDNVVFSDPDLVLVDTIRKAAAIEMQKSDMYRFKTGFRYEDLLVKLIENKDRTRQFIDVMSKNLGVHIQNNVFIAVFPVPKEYKENEFLLKRTTYELRDLLSGTLAAIYKDAIVVLFTCKPEEPLSPEIRNQIDGYLKRRHIFGGISQKFTDLVYANKYYEQALEALTLSQLLEKPGNIFLLQELIVYELISSVSLSKDILNYVFPKVNTLIEYDREYSTSYFETLNSLMRNCINIKETANELYIHRNTLFHRINKIKEIADIDFENSEDNFQIQLSLRILEYIAKSKRNGTDDPL